MAVMRGEVQYARNGDLSIAYQRFGNGSTDLVVVPGWASNLDAVWDFPPLGPMFARLGEYARCIVFDKRGTGLSDRGVDFGSLEERAQDIAAVMDAAGVEHASLFAYSESAALALLFAASHSQRVDRLVLYSSYARLLSAPDYPDGFSAEVVEAFVEQIQHAWGQGTVSRVSFQGVPETPAVQRLLSRWERSLCTPTMAAHIIACNAAIDIRPVLATVNVPTLVIHSSGDPVAPPALGRYVADGVPGARYVQRDAAYHLPWYGQEAWFLDEIVEFLTGRHTVAATDSRVLATVLFTDIVRSTEAVAARGDRAWRGVLDGHDELAASCVGRLGGELVKSTGDGVLAVFDRPSRAVACAASMCNEMQDLGIQVRAGIHSGEIERRGDDIGGLAVHIAARIASLAAPGEVVVSRTVRDLTAGSDLGFIERGCENLKGIPGQWDLFTYDTR